MWGRARTAEAVCGTADAGGVEDALDAHALVVVVFDERQALPHADALFVDRLPAFIGKTVECLLSEFAHVSSSLLHMK